MSRALAAHPRLVSGQLRGQFLPEASPSPEPRRCFLVCGRAIGRERGSRGCPSLPSFGGAVPRQVCVVPRMVPAEWSPRCSLSILQHDLLSQTFLLPRLSAPWMLFPGMPPPQKLPAPKSLSQVLLSWELGPDRSSAQASSSCRECLSEGWREATDSGGCDAPSPKQPLL